MLERRPPLPGTPTADADGSETSDVPFGALEPSVGIRDWLLGEGARIDKAERMLEGLAERLIDIGVPVDRASTAIDTLHSEYAGVGRVWTRNGGVTVRLFPHGSRSQEAYLRSPFAEVHQTGRWLILDLSETPDDAYAIVPDLKAEGSRTTSSRRCSSRTARRTASPSPPSARRGSSASTSRSCASSCPRSRR